MKDDSREKRRRELLPRISLLACLGLVVVSLGVALSPQTPEEPAEPPFSEQARSAALAETMRLRAAGEQLSQSPSADGQPAVARTVSLLTSQAQALLVPGLAEPGASPRTGNDTTSTAPAAAASAASASGSAAAPASGPASSAAVPASGPASSAAVPASAAALAQELAASASQRLADAAVADGGMARLLAAVGTAQLLQASALAAAAGAPAPDVPDPAAPQPSAPQPSGVCPSASASPSPVGASAGNDPVPASLPAALAATVETELETVYGYQVALTRLSGEAAAPASEQLARHEALATGAEALSRMNCAPIPPREAGYTMAPGFLASPSAGLGGLEASALPVYGDLVALSDGETRQWAISGLVGAARRTAIWGADAGALPGLAADPDTFPELP